MRRAIYPGSFDPVTNGHLDIIQRGCKLFDEIIVAILINPEKTPFFSVEERKEILTDVLKDIEQGGCKVVVDSFAGLLVQYAAEKEAHAIVRGIRAISDYEYELQMALMNRRLQPALWTAGFSPRRDIQKISGRSLITSAGVLSVRIPRKRGCRSLPSSVHSLKPISATIFGSSQ